MSQQEVAQEFDKVAFLREHRPELFELSSGELRKKFMDTMGDLRDMLVVARDRGVGEGYEVGVLDTIDPVVDEYGWEGVGR